MEYGDLVFVNDGDGALGKFIIERPDGDTSIIETISLNKWGLELAKFNNNLKRIGASLGFAEYYTKDISLAYRVTIYDFFSNRIARCKEEIQEMQNTINGKVSKEVRERLNRKIKLNEILIVKLENKRDVALNLLEKLSLK